MWRPAILALAVLVTGCSGGPAEPQTGVLTGRWEGTFAVESCEVSGVYSNCSGLGPGSTLLAGLLFLEAERSGIAGYSSVTTHPSDVLRREAMESGFMQPFHTSLMADRSLSFSATNGKAPTTVMEMSWDLRLSGTTLTGTLRVRSHWYKQPGEIKAAGVVTLTKR
jgi:hypothetical protein